MNYILSIIAGLIQGVTEFLPVSSSGHLVLFHDIFNFSLPDNIAFDAVLHLGTLLSLLIFFRKEISHYIRGFFKSIGHFDIHNSDQRLSFFIIIATIPAVIAGYFFEDVIEKIFRTPQSVAFMLIFFGIILYIVDMRTKKIKKIEDITLYDSIVIGVAQVLSLIPGVSRSGITIIAGLSQNLQRQDAAKFSFLLGIPVILGAGVKKFFDLNSMDSSQIVILSLGFVVSLVAGLLTIRFFIKFLSNHSLKIFAYYRIVLGIIILSLIYFV